MDRKRLAPFVALLSVLVLVATACGGGDGGQTEDDQEVKRGGVFRMETDGFEWTNSFDPTGEYLATAWTFYSNLLLRPLLGYKHAPGVEGNELVPDLATDLGQVSEDGLTYTFKLKTGVKFAPPVNREVEAKDVLYAFKRIGTSSLAAQYGFYYEPLIEGLVEFKEGEADEISGIQVVDKQTIRFKLKKPSGDFLYTLAMPASAPIPEEVARCFTKAGEYGRYVIASGPYMIKGSDKLNVTDCRSMKPLEGFDPTKRLHIVRNPNYDDATDNREYRENNVDEFRLDLNPNTENIFDKISRGELEGEIATPPAPVRQQYVTDPKLKDRLKSSPGDRTWYITMTLTEPPFDDLHVRKAANLVMNKAGLQRIWGGPTAGDIADHIIPPAVLNGLLPKGEIGLYQTPNDEGDVEAAKEEMRQSKYDTDKDGMCDAPACRNVLHLTRNTPPQADMAPVIEESFKKIGITLRTQESENSYPILQEPAKKIPVASNAGWGKDFADASTYAVLFDSRSILKSGNTNYSLVGLTREQAREIGSDYVEGIPSVDADIDNCAKLPRGNERDECWANLDRKLMTDVVPWVPYLWGNNIDVISEAVTKYEFDQFSAEMAYSKVAVDPAKQKGLTS